MKRALRTKRRSTAPGHGPATVAPFGSVSGIADQEVAEFSGRGGTNPWRLMYHLTLAGANGGIGNTNIRPRLGVYLGGANVTDFSAGSAQADVEWNQNGNYGDLSICGNATNCDLTVQGSGVTDFWQAGLGGGNGTLVGNQPSGHAAALGVYTNCVYGNGLMEVMDGNQSMNGNISAGADGQIVLMPSSGSGAGVDAYLTTDGYANVTVHAANGGNRGLVVSRLYEAQTFTFSTLPSAATMETMRGVRAASSTVIAGVRAYWHTSVSKWTT